MIQTYKILHPTEGYDKSLPQFLETASTQNLRGHSSKLFVQHINKDIRKYNFSIRIINHWNDLPGDVKSAGDVWEFERKLDSYWANQPLLYDNHKTKIILKKDVPKK